MGILDYFKPAKSISADDARKLLGSLGPEDYTLIDVRQPKEYERGHIPGARLIPLGELPQRLEEIERSKPAVLY